jgi:transposase
MVQTGVFFQRRVIPYCHPPESSIILFGHKVSSLVMPKLGGSFVLELLGMPTAIPHALRHAIRQRARRGQTAARIATDLRLAPSTVRGLVRQFREQPERLTPHYEHGGVRRAPARQALVEVACALRREHPTWGAGLIRLHLPTVPNVTVPGERTVSRWLHEAGLAPARPGRRPNGSRLARAQRPHAVWQIPLATGQRISWLRITDEFSGAVLATTVFSPRQLEYRGRDGHARRVANDLHALGAPRLCARG